MPVDRHTKSSTMYPMTQELIGERARKAEIFVRCPRGHEVGGGGGMDVNVGVEVDERGRRRGRRMVGGGTIVVPEHGDGGWAKKAIFAAPVKQAINKNSHAQGNICFRRRPWNSSWSRYHA